MSSINISKIKNHDEKRFYTFLLIFIFTFMTGFAPTLHNHEFDLDDPHEDCSPCQWTQINTDIGDSSQDLFSIPFERYYSCRLTLVIVPNFPFTFSGLSPPSSI